MNPRDEAGNMGYATNIVVYSVVTNGTFEHNAAGCITNIAHTGTGGYSDSLALDWDERYRLTSVDGASCSVEYEYDVLNRKTARIEGTNIERYIYAGNQVVADLDGSGNLLRTYIWGTGIDNLLSFTDHTTSNTYYAIKDIQNTVIALVDSGGNIVETYDYDAWGRTKVFNASGEELSESGVGNRYCFQGREIDWDTGLIYFRARWYNPVSGRWLSKDPIGIAGGLNMYAFCGNNPVNFVDPFGFAPGDPYPSPDAAAVAASGDIYGPSISGDVEMGGWITPTDGGFTYTAPVTGGQHHVDIGSKPSGAVAWYHSHGRYSEGYNDDHFSGRHGQPFFPGDKKLSLIKKANAYLVTPDGTVKLYRPGLKRDNETTIGKVGCGGE